jgi:hypothetical protein
MSRSLTESASSEFLMLLDATKAELIAEYDRDTAMGINFHDAKRDMVQAFEKLVLGYVPPIGKAIFEDTATMTELVELLHLDFSTSDLSEQTIAELKEQIKIGADYLIECIDMLHTEELDSLGKTEFNALKDLYDFIIAYDRKASHLAIERAEKSINVAFESMLPETVLTQIKSKIRTKSDRLNQQLADKLAHQHATCASTCRATLFGGAAAVGADRSVQPEEDSKENISASKVHQQSAFSAPTI